MVYIDVDGKRYAFDTYDDMEVCKEILEDILKTNWTRQQLKTIRLVNTLGLVLDGRFSPDGRKTVQPKPF